MRPEAPVAGLAGLAGALLLAALVCGLAAPAAAEVPRPPAGPPTERPRDLPLVEVPVPAGGPESELLAVLLTGDGGWAVTDKGLARSLSQRGMPVVGWNALRYFLHKRNPDGTTRDLERILRCYLAAWHRERVVLIGYSFGADVMPFLVHRLAPDLRARISLLALLGPGARAGFRFHLAEWLGKESADTLPVRPEVESLRGMPILCAYGQQEAQSLCKELSPGLARVLVRPGSHIIGR
ncbi:MAG TPA: AcvB/VirJ family lysyl-phosphatidylglycerol hydrolase, partial [Thermoanaerobaculia bacterium]|nr:AcvB/VirJ family lysyl-phosphatidylglycerol hydrolase [Thermoanaerobaculia bacterium]